MLSPADAELVQRDIRLPGLAALLDPARLIGHLRQLLGGEALPVLRTTYLNYRPGKLCRAGYEIDGATGVQLVHATAYPGRARPTLAARGAPDAERLDAGRLVLEDEALVVDVFPNDRRLPALAELHDLGGRRGLLAALLPDRPDLWDSDVTRLRYRPERRYVAKLQGPDGKMAVVKLYAPRDYGRACAAGLAFGAEGAPKLPRHLGCDDERRARAIEWLPGDELTTRLKQSEPDTSTVARVGAALAALHSRTTGPLPAWSGADQGEALHRVAAWLGFALPSQARRAEALARKLAAALKRLPAGRHPLHGDYSPSQVVVMHGGIGVIDLDDAVRGDPAVDLADFASRIERHALRGSIPHDALDQLRDAFFAGYRAAAGQLPNAIPLHVAAGLLRFAQHPFRARARDWPEEISAILDRAETWLARARAEACA